MQRIYRSRKERVLAGVCGGIGVAADLDPSLVRLAWVLLTLLSLVAGAWFLVWILLYLAAWLIVPMEPEAGPAPPYTSPTGGSEGSR
jgi:phage shock protein PspC (stress-responsive transcriptional regulator)